MAYHAPLVVQFGIKQNPSVLWRDITTCSNLYTGFSVMNHDRFRTQVHSVTITKPEYLMTKTAERSEQIILTKMATGCSTIGGRFPGGLLRERAYQGTSNSSAQPLNPLDGSLRDPTTTLRTLILASIFQFIKSSLSLHQPSWPENCNLLVACYELWEKTEKELLMLLLIPCPLKLLLYLGITWAYMKTL
jgi:hypothetical protein